jgi:hypothetical protein
MFVSFKIRQRTAWSTPCSATNLSLHAFVISAYTCADVTKAYNLLGYKAAVPFEEGIRRTVKWYDEAYLKKEIDVCPEMQANGMGRAPSMVDLKC